MTPWIVSHLWLIPAAPLAASALIIALGGSRRGPAAGLAILGQVVALALAVAAFLPTLQTPGWREWHNFDWFTFGDSALRIGWVLDPLTAAMCLMITLVGLCIFVFSVGYMAEDKNFARFFAYLSFFSAAMLGVVISNSLLLLFVCWELVRGSLRICLSVFGFTNRAPRLRRRRRSSQRASATSGFSSGFSGSIATAVHSFFTTVAKAVLKARVSP